jgi:catechol 2,3-dioxygenase-like lactoylglutathione lyase family enzyme
MLGDAPLVAFVSTADPDACRTFYAERLGLEFVADEPYALVFEAPNAMLRIAKVEEVSPTLGTVLGWEVEDVASAVASLSADGVEFLFYDDLPQDERGVATFPDGARIAWFPDPDGNVLSLSEFSGEREA